MNLRTKHESLLCNWIHDCTSNPEIANLAEYHLQHPVSDELIWQYNINLRDSQTLFPGNTFWHTLVHMWHAYSYCEPQGGDKVRQECVNFNSSIKIRDKIINIASLRGVRVGDLCKEKSGEFLPYQEFVRKNNRFQNISWLMYGSIVAAVPPMWKEFLKSSNFIDTHTPKYEMIWGIVKSSQIVYRDKLHSDETLHGVCSIWNKKLGLTINIPDCRKYFCSIYELTTVVKFRDFQFRLLHNKIFCNDILIYWKKVTSNLCDFCKIEKQTILHLMFSCRRVRPIWKRLEAMCIREKIGGEFNISKIIFNTVHDDYNHVLNLVVLIIKQYLYRSKCLLEIPNYKQVILNVKLQMQIEKQGIFKNNCSSVRKVDLKWSPVKNIIL